LPKSNVDYADIKDSQRRQKTRIQRALATKKISRSWLQREQQKQRNAKKEEKFIVYLRMREKQNIAKAEAESGVMTWDVLN